MPEKAASTLPGGRCWLSAVFLIALSLRVAAVVWVDLGIGQLHDPNEQEFGYLAERLVRGDGYVRLSYSEATGYGFGGGRYLPSAYMPPAYPVLVAACLQLVGPGKAFVVALQLIHCFLGACLSLLIYAIGWKTFSATTGMLAAFCLAFYPVFLYLPSQFSAASLYIPLFYCVVLFSISSDAWKSGKMAGLGLLTGLAALARANLVIYVALLPLSWAIGRRNALARAVVIYSAAALLALSPWLVRNYLRFGAPVLTTSFGQNLWVGHNDRATGSALDVNGKRFLAPSADAANSLRVPPTDAAEAILDDRYLSMALDSIRANPVRSVVWLPLKKLWLFVSWDTTSALSSSLLYRVPWLLILFLGIAGMVNTRHRIRDLSLLYLVIAATAVECMVFFVLPRYRLIIEPVVILFAAHAAVTWTQKLRVRVLQRMSATP